MPIVLISESLLLRATVRDGRILRDRMLSGFCVRMNPRKVTFRVATSVAGKQFRMNLGHWPLMSVEEARAQAMEVLAKCRRGERPHRPAAPAPSPTLREVYADYCRDKRIKPSSQSRYESLLRTHFGAWLDRPVSELGQLEFTEHCRAFAQRSGAALVELARGVVGAVIKYANALHGLELASPFAKLAAVGLLPERAQPRARVLQEADLPAWRAALDKLGERQRDFLLLTLYTGLRRNECADLRRDQIDLVAGVLSVPETKNGKPHSLPITPAMREILERRCAGLEAEGALFKGVAAGHLSKMAVRVGAPAFMLHDLRKLLATVGERLGVGDAVLRRILNHTPQKGDVLHRHYVQLGVEDVKAPMERIQASLDAAITAQCPG
ncbi:tyrosine-type recombinase/integrase [Hydrogenophaga intermedia]|uniref:tyrosine-type recombinase/integrase n=1 Tax=Hydrogenophaga intermedia TaxID=65786 RepID=UPI002043C5E4|nr:integrase family protein [Hydrogenophaga intermedia]